LGAKIVNKKIYSFADNIIKMNIAIILAAGSGNRMKTICPKPYIIINGKTILEHTIDVFEKNALINEIAVVLREDDVADFERFITNNNWKKVKKILKGGKERFQSAWAAINAYQQFPQYNLLLHDAARPLVSDRIINDVVEALEKYNAVSVAIPSVDTLYEVDKSQQFIANIPNRSCFFRAQTPQAFKAETIQKAYQKALKDPDFQSTDDCGVVAKYLPDEKNYIVHGEERNMKLTYEEDLDLLKTLFSRP
jgi:2-C-methyl-D-erythritol 4-phosphate cytidylyltransferase